MSKNFSVDSRKEEVTGIDVALAISATILSVILSMLATVFTLAISFELLYFIRQLSEHAQSQQTEWDGFHALGALVISTILFVPISFLYFKRIRNLLGKLIKTFRRV